MLTPLVAALVSWKATHQHFVALSTTKAEYMALTEAAKEGIWLRGLINDLRINQEYANIYCDNLSAICFAKDQVHHDRTKHIDVRYHFICQKEESKFIRSALCTILLICSQSQFQRASLITA